MECCIKRKGVKEKDVYISMSAFLVKCIQLGVEGADGSREGKLISRSNSARRDWKACLE